MGDQAMRLRSRVSLLNSSRRLGPAHAGVETLLLSLTIAACGGSVDGSGDDGTAGNSSAGNAGAGGSAVDAGSSGIGGSGGSSGTAGTAGTGGAGGMAGGAGTGGEPPCGSGKCPAHMTCGIVGGQPWCRPDADQDGVVDGSDNCPYVSNPGQEDQDADQLGDACDACNLQSSHEAACIDPDGDGIPGGMTGAAMKDGQDNCPYQANPNQEDSDADGVGDACDLCPDKFNPLSPCGDVCMDSDGDGIADKSYCSTTDEVDNCQFTPAKPSLDTDADGVGDVCDPDGIAPTTAALSSRQERRRVNRMELLKILEKSGVLSSDVAAIAMRA